MHPIAVEQRTERQISASGNYNGVYFSFVKPIVDKEMLLFAYLMDRIN